MTASDDFLEGHGGAAVGHLRLASSRPIACRWMTEIFYRPTRPRPILVSRVAPGF